MTDPRLHRRQFVIGPSPFTAGDDWHTVRLLSGAFLSYSGSLPVAQATVPGKRSRVLLGIATVPSGPDPIESLSNGADAELDLRVKHWTGRWVMINDVTMTPDAGALLGVYHTEPLNGAPVWISSSPGLLLAASGLHREEIARSIQRHRGINWYPPPMSRFKGVRRLLPGISINIITGQTRTNSALELESLPYPVLFKELRQHLVGTMRRVSRGAGRVLVPLTAGYDSRLVLAAAIAAKINVTAFTQRYAGMSKSDSEMPAKLAEAVGIDHIWIEPGVVREDLQILYDEHTSGSIFDADREFFARGQWSWTLADDVILRGGVFEVGRCHYWDRISPGPEDLSVLSNSLRNRSFQRENDEGILLGLRFWLNNIKSSPIKGVDWRDRFYIEQRVGGWLSSIEQSLDMVVGEKFHVANSARFFELLLSIPRSIRIKSRHQVDLITDLCPVLGRFRFNRPSAVRSMARFARYLMLKSLILADRQSGRSKMGR